MIRGITFSEQMFYSADFAHFMNTFLCGGIGITKGCSCTSDGTKVNIGTGYFVAHGRLMNVESDEVVDATRGFQTGYNRIVYEIDLSKENTILDFRQGAIKVIQTETLIQEDLDATGKVYQFPFCHFQWSGTAITSFVVDAPTLVVDDILGQWSDNYTAINAQFDIWFAQQKTATTNWINQQKPTVEDLIASLEAGGFARTTSYSAAIGTSWSGSSAPFTQNITVSGILATDEPIVDLVTTTSNYEKEMEEYAKIFKITTSANKITVYATEKTTASIQIKLKVVR